jgi:hypothetical protein
VGIHLLEWWFRKNNVTWGQVVSGLAFRKFNFRLRLHSYIFLNSIYHMNVSRIIYLMDSIGQNWLAD